MYKKLITLLMIGVCFSSYAQKNIYSTREEAAKVAAINAQTKLLDKMQAQLKDTENKPKFKGSEINVKKDTIQFLYEENKLADLLGFKIDKTGSIKTNNKGEKQEETEKNKADRSLQAIFDKLCALNANNGNPTILKKENILTLKNSIKFGYNRKETIDSALLIVPVSFEVHTTANKNISNAKYKVTGEWHITVAKDRMEVPVGTKKKDAPIGYKVQKEELESFVVYPIVYLSSEIEAMKNSAKDTIAKWYAHLPETLKAEYVNQAKGDIPTYDIDPANIKIDSRDGKTIIVKNIKDIEFNIEPKLDYDKIYYEDLTASMKITPSFKIIVANDFKTVESMEVTYGEPNINNPRTRKEKLEMRNEAMSMINELCERLSTYVNANAKEQKTDILEMFEAIDNGVKVSHKFKNGKEKIDSRTVKKYLDRLNGTNLTFADSKMINENMVNELNAKYPELGLVFDSNLYTIMYKINQRYESKTYKDSTDKIVFLNYNDKNKEYRINKIEVIPNSTKIE